jgi:Ca-activated chloride channel family protein
VPKQVRVGLILFAGDASVAAQPSTDHSQVRQALDYAESYAAFGGTAIGDALQRAVELARQTVPGLPTLTGQTIAFTKGTQSSPVTILFLSDGHQTRGVLQPLEGADLAKAAGIPVNTIALGTPNGTLDQSQLGPYGGPANPYGAGPFNVAPDPKTLHAIANDTGGKFFAAQSEKAVRSAYANLSSRIGRKPVQQEVTSRFVLLAALLLVAAGIVSRPWAPRLP